MLSYNIFAFRSRTGNSRIKAVGAAIEPTKGGFAGDTPEGTREKTDLYTNKTTGKREFGDRLQEYEERVAKCQCTVGRGGVAQLHLI